jgi:formyltetrahydrofolate hydrolase
MDFFEKAKIRLERWQEHNDHHMEEYESFVRELEEAGKEQSAQYMREMMELVTKGNDCLRRALEVLEDA